MTLPYPTIKTKLCNWMNSDSFLVSHHGKQGYKTEPYLQQHLRGDLLKGPENKILHIKV